MSEIETSFVADLDLRLDAPRRERARARLAVAALAALAIELGAVGVAWREQAWAPKIPPQAEEIPVEVVVEPPPPPPPPPQPSPTPQPETKPQEYEKPATDAPREGKSDHDDETVAEKEKPTPPPPPAATPSPEASQPAEAPAPEAPPKEAEAELPAPVKAEPTATPAPVKTPSLAERIANALEPPPDLDYGGEAMKSPVTGGNAKAAYLSMLYGLIVPRLRVPAVAHAYGRKLTGAIGFSVDGRGRLVARFVAEGSGSMELDEAAMQAVSAAARAFPPPPKGAPMGMKFTYSVN